MGGAASIGARHGVLRQSVGSSAATSTGVRDFPAYSRTVCLLLGAEDDGYIDVRGVHPTFVSALARELGDSSKLMQVHISVCLYPGSEL